MRGMQHERVFGWFDFEDVYDKAIYEASDGAVFIEVGSFLGKSACYLAERIRQSGKRINVYCVDHFRMGAEERQHKEMQAFLDSLGGNYFLEFMRNTVAFRDIITPVACNSVSAAEFFPDGCADFIFIDGAHDEDSVRADLSVWGPKLKTGAMIAGHDYDRASVRKIVDETYPERKLNGRSWLSRDFDDLVIFANWYRNLSGTVPPCPMDSVRRLGNFHGLTVYREGPFQVQLWTGAPNASVKDHHHPLVDTIQIYLSGQIYLRINGVPVVSPDRLAVLPDGTANFRGQSVRIRPNDMHGFDLGPLGGAWMTIEKWLDGKPTSTELSWEGEPIDKIHAALIGA